MAGLTVTPEELMNLANQVAEKAEELNNLATNLDTRIEAVANSWSGMSSNAYYNSYVEMQEAVHQFPQVVQAIASSAQAAAKAYDDTDAELARAFKG